MKSNVWLLCVALLSAGFIGCSKKQALSPEDTALLKGGTRGTFVNGDGTSGEGEDLLSPVGATITGLTGDGLAPQDVAAYLDTNTNARILVEGYCDWKGTPAYNKSLGDRRASSVKQYLVDLGADSNRVDILSMGDELATPDADSTTSALERKAHFVVLSGS
jgi:hypothetical protein